MRKRLLKRTEVYLKLNNDDFNLIEMHPYLWGGVVFVCRVIEFTISVRVNGEGVLDIVPI